MPRIQAIVPAISRFAECDTSLKVRVSAIRILPRVWQICPQEINHSGFFIHFFDTYRRNFHDDSASVRKATLESVVASKECFSYHNNVVHILPHCLHLMVDSNSSVREQCHKTFKVISEYILSQPFEPLREELKPLKPWDMPDIFRRLSNKFVGGHLLLSDGKVDPVLEIDNFESPQTVRTKKSSESSLASKEQISYVVPKDDNKGKKTANSEGAVVKTAENNDNSNTENQGGEDQNETN